MPLVQKASSRNDMLPSKTRSRRPVPTGRYCGPGIRGECAALVVAAAPRKRQPALALSGARFAPIHERDMAEIAALALRGPGHAGKTYALTGPEAITAAEQLFAIARSNADLRWEEARATPRAPRCRSLPPLLEGILASWERATYEPPFVTDTVARVLGKPARNFEQWAADHAETFARSAA